MYFLRYGLNYGVISGYLYGMKDTLFKKILASVGLVIEGRSDDELPECLIGVVQVCYPDPVIAIQASDFFSGKAPRSFEPSSSDSAKPAATPLLRWETRPRAPPWPRSVPAAAAPAKWG